MANTFIQAEKNIFLEPGAKLNITIETTQFAILHINIEELDQTYINDICIRDKTKDINYKL